MQSPPKCTWDVRGQAHENELVVVGSLEMGTAEHTPIREPEDMRKLQLKLRLQMRLSRHPAFVMWMVGNEVRQPRQLSSGAYQLAGMC